MAIGRRSAGGFAAVALAACNALTGAGDLGTVAKDAGGVVGDDAAAPARDGGAEPGPPGSVRGSDAAAGGINDAGFEASTRAPDFADDFARPDGTIGNGWLVKGDGFSLVGGGVVQNAVGDFTNFLVWRPPAETIRDVEVSVDVTYGATADPDPSLFVRVQPSSEAANEVDAYTFYTWENKTAVIDRLDPATGFETLASGSLTPAPAAGQTYRLFLRVVGDNPVTLEASVLTTGGAVVTSLRTSDGTAKRIAGPGRIGFGSGRARGTRWDNFARVDL